MSERPTSKIALSQLADGEKIKECIDYMEKAKTKIDAEYDTSEFRLKTDKITFTDLDSELKEALNTTFDDSYIRTRLVGIETTLEHKADRCDLKLYRKLSTHITKSDLDEALVNYIDNIGSNYDDSYLKENINILHSTKTDKAESGLIKNLDEDLNQLIVEYSSDDTISSDKVTMVDALNFLFKQCILTIKVNDFGFVTQEIDETLSIDMGYVTAENILETIDYGLITDEVRSPAFSNNTSNKVVLYIH